MDESSDPQRGAPVAVAETNGHPPSRPGFAQRSATFIGSFALAGRVLERLAVFGQIVLIASVYGSTVPADVYFVASIVPLIIGTVLGESIAVAILPPLVRRSAKEELEGLIGAGFRLSLSLLVLALTLYLAVAVPIVELRLKGDMSQLGPWVAFAPIGLLLGLSGYFGAILLQFERYVWPPFRTAVAAVGTLVLTGVVLAATRDVVWVAVAMSAGYALSLTLLIVEVGHVAGFGWLRRPPAEYFREIAALRGRIAASVASGLLGGQVFVLIERALAASLGVGAVATLSYARGIAFSPNVLGQAVSAGLYPGTVRAYEARHAERVAERFVRGLRMTLFLSLGVVAFFAAFGPNVVAFLLQRGALEAPAASEAGRVLSAFSLAFLANMVVIFTARMFYAVDLFRATVWSQGTALALYLVLVQPFRGAWGLTGLAFAFGIAEVAGALVALVLAARRVELSGWDVLRRAVAPAVRRGGVVAAAVVGYRLVLAATDIPIDLRGVAFTGGGLAVLALATVLALWTCAWPEAQRLKQAPGRLAAHARGR